MSRLEGSERASDSLQVTEQSLSFIVMVAERQSFKMETVNKPRDRIGLVLGWNHKGTKARNREMTVNIQISYPQFPVLCVARWAAGQSFSWSKPRVRQGQSLVIGDLPAGEGTLQTTHNTPPPSRIPLGSLKHIIRQSAHNKTSHV